MSLRNLLIAGAAAFAFALPSAAEAQSSAVILSDLNLRAGPGTAHGIISTMPAGAAVSVHQCSAGWCQVTFANRSGWASQRYLDMRVAAAPAPRTTWRAGPTVGFHLHAGAPPYYGPRYAYRPAWRDAWHRPHWWHSRPAGWYGPVYWDRSRWYHGGRWHTSPSFAFQIGLG